MQLIDTKDIAELLGLTRDYVTDRLTKQPGFPKPKINISQKTRRWCREEILQWAAVPA